MIEIRKGRYSTITPRIGGTLLPSSVVSSPGPSGQSDPGKRGALARRSSSPGKGGNCRDIHATRMCVHVGVLASCVHIDLNIHTTSMHAGMHTYVCTDIYIYIYPYTHIYIYIVTYSYTVHLHMHIHTYIHTYIHTHIHTHIHTCIHTYICTYRYTGCTQNIHAHTCLYLLTMIWSVVSNLTATSQTTQPASKGSRGRAALMQPRHRWGESSRDADNRQTDRVQKHAST